MNFKSTNKTKTIKTTLYVLVIGIFVVICSLIILASIYPTNGIRLLIVSSGSMHPNLKLGSVVGIKPQKKYFVGDIITYKPLNQIKNNKPPITTTHRITKVENVGDATYFRTKGDANEIPDFGKIKQEQILGKVFFNLPYVGRFIVFLKSQTGFILFIIIPVTILIYSELVNIKNEAKRLIKEKRIRKLTWIEKGELALGQEMIEIERDFVTDITGNRRRPI
jgi:signal peptidase